MSDSNEQHPPRAHKIALVLTARQQRVFNQNIGACKYAYNYMVEKTKADYDRVKSGEQEKYTPYNVFAKEYTQHRKTLKWQKPLCSTFQHKAVGIAKDALMNAIKGKRGFPKFKNRHNEAGATYNEGADNCKAIKVSGKRIWLPSLSPSKRGGYGLGWLKMRECFRFQNHPIIKCTIKRRGNKYYVSLIARIDEPLPQPRETDKWLGIDMGVKTLATCADDKGEDRFTIDNPKPLQSTLKRLRQLQRRISRMRLLNGNKSSPRCVRLQKQLSNLHARIANIRKETAEQSSHAILKKYPQVRMETLNIKGMAKNKRLARAIGDAGMGNFQMILKQKSKRMGAIVEEIGQWAPSSKTCSKCGHKKKNFKLSERAFKCENCGHSDDRDFNAAINIARGIEENNGSAQESGLAGNSNDAVKPAIKGKPKQVSASKGNLALFDAEPPTAIRQDSGTRECDVEGGQCELW